ncbi:hypothetical protein AAVH_08199 [Aphelenchoides avenae]|nr:hypothetical protein AAVH_08199 [Aphelenchus avenae]
MSTAALQSERAWPWIQVAVEAPFLLFHVSVCLCITTQIRRRNAAFSTPFFYLYSIQSLVDVVYYVESVVFFRLFRIALLPIWVGESPFRNVQNFTTVYMNTYQFVSHMVIALNRYRAIDSTNTAKTIWSGRALCIVLAFMLISCLPPAILRLLSPLFVKVDSQGFYIVVSGKDVAALVAPFSTFLYCIVTSIASIYLELRTLLTYRKLSSIMRKRLRSDFRLLLYAMLQFIGQFLMAIYSTLSIASALTGDSRYVSWAQAYHPVIVDILCLSGPICLIVTSKVVRREYLNFCGLCKNAVTPFTTSSEASPPNLAP